MSDFSTISFSSSFPLLDGTLRAQWYQTKDLPEHETESACIDGEVQADGRFVRSDGKWNVGLNGWVRLIGQFTDDRLAGRFQNGYLVEVLDNLKLSQQTHWAWNSPSRWQAVQASGRQVES